MTESAEIHARPKMIGARIKRTEDPRLLSGTGAFADDRQLPRVLHVAFCLLFICFFQIARLDTLFQRLSVWVR